MRKWRQAPQNGGGSEMRSFLENQLLGKEKQNEDRDTGVTENAEYDTLLQKENLDLGRQQSLGEEEHGKLNMACLCQEIESLSREVEHYRNMAIERCMADDLSAIRELDPKVEGLESLGAEYLELIKAGVNAPIAYHAISAMRGGKNPPSMGDVRAMSDTEEGTFSYAQAMAMAPDQVAANYEKLRRSMRGWK